MQTVKIGAIPKEINVYKKHSAKSSALGDVLYNNSTGHPVDSRGANLQNSSGRPVES